VADLLGRGKNDVFTYARRYDDNHRRISYRGVDAQMI
jgi:hypothetical protein